MVAPESFAWTFRDVAVCERDRIYFVAGHDESVEKNLPVSFFFKWNGSAWSSKPFSHNLTGICFIREPELNTLMMSVDGAIVRGMPAGFTEEQVDTGKEAPRAVGDLREIRRIGQRAYVAGMRRMVYRRDGPDQWKRIDQGVRCGPGDKTNAGFNSIDGFSETEIYAVGWEGEIWKYDGKRWIAIESPTNLALFRVLCAGDGKAYACGQMGTLLVGRDTQWQVIKQDATEEDFWGATWFKNRLYLSTSNGIYVLVDDAVAPVEIKSSKKINVTQNDCFFRLDANAEMMWSIGEKMAIWTEDGVKWTEVPYS